MSEEGGCTSSLVHPDRRNCVPYRLEEKQPEAICCSGSHAQRATGRESQWSSRRSFCRGEAVQGSSAPLVVARNVYSDVADYCANCPQCAIVNPSGRVNRPPLHPIPVQRVFQIVNVDVMDLPKTEAGNKHVVVFQDFLSQAAPGVPCA